MAYNRPGKVDYSKYNWCKVCNLITSDKSVTICPVCNHKVRFGPRSYGQKLIRQEQNLSKKVITTVLNLLDDKRGLSARRIIEITYQKTGVNIIE